MWIIATDDGVIQAHEIDIRDGMVYVDKKDLVIVTSASVITGKTATCPEDLLPPVLASVGVESLREISIPYERVRFFIHAADTEPEEETDE